MSKQNLRTMPDELLLTIADYVFHTEIDSEIAYKTAEMALLDSFACAILALKEPMCSALLGPYVPGTAVPMGSRVPGTDFELDPIKAAFDIGVCIRWLDFNDTWLAKEWGHPSDNLGGILAISDYQCRRSLHHLAKQSKKDGHTNNHGKRTKYKSKTDHEPITGQLITLKTVCEAMIKAYEIQGILALGHSFNQLGFDHVILVKIATTAVVAKLWGLSKDQCIDALSHAFVDGASLRTYRHAPNTGSRKSWAAGDATRRGVELCWLVLQGQTGLPSALTAKNWGFNDVLLEGRSMVLTRSFGSFVMENILFKVAYPAEFHAQTAVEAAIQLHAQFNIAEQLDAIDKIVIHTQESAIRIINKEGPLYNYADRDHSLQYIVAIGLLFGTLKPEHYSDNFAKDPRIDKLRSKMEVKEDPEYSQEYLDLEKRSIANAIELYFRDGSKSEKVEIRYPLGHRRRRAEADSLLKQKYCAAILGYYSGEKAEELCSLWGRLHDLSNEPLSDFMDRW